MVATILTKKLPDYAVLSGDYFQTFIFTSDMAIAVVERGRLCVGAPNVPRFVEGC